MEAAQDSSVRPEGCLAALSAQCVPGNPSHDCFWGVLKYSGEQIHKTLIASSDSCIAAIDTCNPKAVTESHAPLLERPATQEIEAAHAPVPILSVSDTQLLSNVPLQLPPLLPTSSPAEEATELEVVPLSPSTK